jgi:two-component system, LytTR family, sensor kinase
MEINLENNHRPVWRRRWFIWALSFGVWTFLAFFFTGQIYYTRLLGERPLPWSEVAKEQFIYPYLWALATPLILWLASRFPIERPRLGRHLLFHFIFSTALAACIMSAFQFIYHVLFVMPMGKPFSPLSMLRATVYNASENYGVYVLIVLLHHAYHYYNRFRQGELRTSQLEARLSQAQLQALKMQLHPHFLFNTLHSISSLVHKNPDAADKMLARLGDFLRMTLENSGAQEVKLKKELEFLRCYLEIERIRFQDRLTTEMRIDPNALDARVPNLILQPIVENAIRYGIAPRSAPGRIEILAEQQNGTLCIEVRDNGPGLGANQRADQVFRKGLGLANTKARLEQLYGAAHRFELAENPGGGLAVKLEIPQQSEPPASDPSNN